MKIMNKKIIRTIIIDDEPVARRIIKKYLKDESEFEIIAECRDGAEAVEKILALKPDLIFLDIQMPEVDGFDVVNSIKAKYLPYIIFVTAYDQYAVKAFEINALDYLLKPFDKARLFKSISRAKDIINSRDDYQFKINDLLAELKNDKKYLNRIMIKSSGRIFFLKTSEIDWIEAAAYYIKIHSGKNSYLIRETLNNFEAGLDPEIFTRVHRSYIVNIEKIREVQPWFNNKYVAILNDGVEVSISRSYKDRFFKKFGMHNSE